MLFEAAWIVGRADSNLVEGKTVTLGSELAEESKLVVETDEFETDVLSAGAVTSEGFPANLVGDDGDDAVDWLGTVAVDADVGFEDT